MIREYKLKDATELKKFIHDLLEKNDMNKKRVELFKNLLMKDSKVKIESNKK